MNDVGLENGLWYGLLDGIQWFGLWDGLWVGGLRRSFVLEMEREVTE
jgi:hypothetical protein